MTLLRALPGGRARGASPGARSGWRCLPTLAVCLAALPGIGGAAVTITGVDESVRNNVLAYLDLDEEACDAPQWRVRQRFQNAEEEIRPALQAFGYYDARVASSLEFTDECWSASFRIEPGEPVRVRDVDVRIEGEAQESPPFDRLLEGFAMHPGDRLDHGIYERFKSDLLGLARQRGYAEARFAVSRIDLYRPQRLADVTVHFDSGPRYRFGEIHLAQDVLDEPLVRAYFDFQKGDPYDNRKLAGLYVALTDSGYFNRVDIRSLAPLAETHEIPVEVALTPGTRRVVTYGVGYSTDTGPRLRYGQTNRRRNLRGHQFGVNTQLSPIISEVSWNYRFPHGDPRVEWVSFSTGLKRQDTDTALSESVEFEARRVFGRPEGWTRTQFLDFVTEDFEVADQSGRTTLLMPGIAWSRTRADNVIRPANGSRLDLEIRGASDAVASETSFLQASARGKWIWSLPSTARLIVRGEAGFTAEDLFQDLPPSVRFFAGGDNSVRGYEYQSLGPMDENGQVIGGSSLLVGSFEYEHPILERWSFALFVDSGNAFKGSRFDTETGAGFGVRWQSPLGPVRADIGFPISDRERGVRLHINLGPDL
jgi:translocation and assembly module TamA